jgi:hypothetical protein
MEHWYFEPFECNAAWNIVTFNYLNFSSVLIVGSDSCVLVLFRFLVQILVYVDVTSHPKARLVSPNQDSYKVSTPKH